MSEETKEEVVPETEVQPETPAEAPAAENTAVAEQQSPHKGFLGKVDNYFGITKSGSRYRTEIVAGLTTFMAMVYILMVNAGMFQFVIGGSNPYGAAYIATAIGAIAGTLLMAFLAKMPLAQASGMGVNAFIVYTLVLGGTGLTYANCMVFTLLDGVIFLILTATGLRQKIFAAIPAGVRHAIPVGIGLFIAFIGMQNAGIVVDNGSTLVTFVSFNVLNKNNLFAFVTASGSIGGMLPALVALLGVIAIAILSKKNVKGAILWGILGSAVVYYILAGIGYAAGSEGCKAIFEGISISNPFDAFAAWGKDSAGKVFYEGFNFAAYFGIEGNNAGTLVVLLITTALSLCMIDMFDTIGTLYGACSKGNLLDENGVPIRMNRMMLSDAIATCAGSIAGTSTVTTFVEASSGVAAGGKTGFTALVTATCFLIAMFLSPIAQLVPSAATATALIWVGVLMMTSVTKVKWEDAGEAIVAFLTFVTMVLGYSISHGIGIGIIAYILVKLCTGKVKEISVATWVIGVLFLATFILT
ncbi:MAG: NCS2 family permease [Clostridia bacterium]|nr:NCS2 family permease [Clostridia bacterium]